MLEAEALEAAVWDCLVWWWSQLDGEAPLARIDTALGLREAAQGPMHGDLIWPLSLKIELIRREHSPEATLQAAQLGERRLALRRLALRDAPTEILLALRELSNLYRFENQVLDPARVKSLEDEIQRLDPS